MMKNGFKISIFEDPTRLGLGELRPIQRERRQSSGGILDILLKDDDSDTLYEVEVMLGKTDESHIIRTIEYWDLERKKNPHYNHIAVIVAEEITNRFFNVINLLSNNIPIIAIQINSLIVDEKMVVDFVKVLDSHESPDIDDIEETKDEITREDWKKTTSPKSFDVFDKIVDLCNQNQLKIEPTYNKYHIALSAEKVNFCWFRPTSSSRNSKYCKVEIKIGEENVQKAEKILNDSNIQFNINIKRWSRLYIDLTSELIKSDQEKILEILKIAHDYCS